MKYIKLLMGSILLLTAFWSCAFFEDDDPDTVEITDINIPDSFNFETEHWVDVELYALYTGTFHLTDMNDKILFKGTIDMNNGFVQKIKLPTRIKEVKIVYKEVETITENYRIRDNEIVYTFVPQYR